MRLFPVLAVIGVGTLAIAGVAYAADKDDDTPPPLPPPPEEECTTSEDVGTATSELLADNTITAQGYRNAANVLRNWTNYCDEQARQAGEASIILLEARATQKDGNQGPSIPGTSPSGFPFPGIIGSHHTTGLHGESGTVYWYGNNDMWFVPDNPLLVPYFIPGGSTKIETSGACCASCAMGQECEGCDG